MDPDVRYVHVTQSSPIKVTLFGVLFVVFLLWHVRWWILGLLLVIALAAVSRLVWRSLQRRWAAQYAEQERLRRAATEQDQWFLAGDPRGMYGHDWRNPDGKEPGS
ncbi:MAG TPA: hypothetical protein VHL57_02360 [Flavobacteriales bacterium]|nr:hypothetical protein [Flavobacteriales bacterium]